jgi:HNH endonuclease
MWETCSIDDCERRKSSRGWCSMHYRRWMRNGDPEKRQRLRGLPPKDRFWARVDASGPCWTWTGGRTANGYGRFGITASNQELAHRFAWIILVGPIPEGLQLDHLCRVRLCVNPDHLEPVTPQENWLRSHTPVGRVSPLGECRRGHPFDEENTYLYKGVRSCKTCRKVRESARREREHAK